MLARGYHRHQTVTNSGNDMPHGFAACICITTILNAHVQDMMYVSIVLTVKAWQPLQCKIIELSTNYSVASRSQIVLAQNIVISARMDSRSALLMPFKRTHLVIAVTRNSPVYLRQSRLVNRPETCDLDFSICSFHSVPRLCILPIAYQLVTQM